MPSPRHPIKPASFPGLRVEHYLSRSAIALDATTGVAFATSIIPSPVNLHHFVKRSEECRRDALPQPKTGQAVTLPT
jgi:hypothetical protein